MEHLSRTAQQRLKGSFLCTSCLRRSISGTAPPARQRRFHTSPMRPQPSPQAQPLGDFYTDLLRTPMPKTSTASSSLPHWVQSGDETKEQRAAKLFGTMRRYNEDIDDDDDGRSPRSATAPDASWRRINGVAVPPRPREPDNCCMSGCAHCVWDDFRDDVEGWAARVREAQAKAHDDGVVPRGPDMHVRRSEVVEASGSMDDDGGGSEGLWDTPSSETVVAGAARGDDLFQGIPVGIREFMATEKRIRDRKRARKERRKAEV